MPCFVETGFTSLNKKGEELCGDKVEARIDGDFTTLVLSDGLGSGVKANILATLTSKILCTMVSNNIGIEDCLETIIQSLPVCSVIGVAYSTFSVVHLNVNGKGFLLEFDNPEAILIRNGKCENFQRERLDILGKIVYKTNLELQPDDLVVMMSDGVIHAGIGKVLNFGWTRDKIMQHLDKVFKKSMSARCTAWLLAASCNDLYVDEPGDDTTVAVVKIKKPLSVKLLVGPPVNRMQDEFVVSKFLEGDGKKIVCGGSSSQMVARFLNEEVKTSVEYMDKDIPPIGFIKGIDLTTEGVLTLNKVLEISERYLSPCDLTPKHFENKKDGASMLAEMLFEDATHVTFYVGQAMNKAHRNLPIDPDLKSRLVDNLANNLKKMGKIVEIFYA